MNSSKAVAARLHGLSTIAWVCEDRHTRRRLVSVICPYCGLVSSSSLEDARRRFYECECGALVFLDEIVGD